MMYLRGQMNWLDCECRGSRSSSQRDQIFRWVTAADGSIHIDVWASKYCHAFWFDYIFTVFYWLLTWPNRPIEINCNELRVLSPGDVKYLTLVVCRQESTTQSHEMTTTTTYFTAGAPSEKIPPTSTCCRAIIRPETDSTTIVWSLSARAAWPTSFRVRRRRSCRRHDPVHN